MSFSFPPRHSPFFRFFDYQFSVIKKNVEQGLTNIDFRNHAILAALFNPLRQQAKPQREAAKQLRKQPQPPKP